MNTECEIESSTQVSRSQGPAQRENAHGLLHSISKMEANGIDASENHNGDVSGGGRGAEDKDLEEDDHGSVLSSVVDK